MDRVVRAGLAYFAVVFAVGFALGTLRTLVVVPAVGETAAVLLELPLMLAASWIASGWIVDRFAVPATVGARFATGAFAFALLMLAELALSVFLAGRTPAGHLALYALVPHQLGLAGQIAFALFPLARLFLAARRG
jgi:hypothetical protein